MTCHKERIRIKLCHTCKKGWAAVGQLSLGLNPCPLSTFHHNWYSNVLLKSPVQPNFFFFHVKGLPEVPSGDPQRRPGKVQPASVHPVPLRLLPGLAAAAVRRPRCQGNSGTRLRGIPPTVSHRRENRLRRGLRHFADVSFKIIYQNSSIIIVLSEQFFFGQAWLLRFGVHLKRKDVLLMPTKYLQSGSKIFTFCIHKSLWQFNAKKVLDSICSLHFGSSNSFIFF